MTYNPVRWFKSSHEIRVADEILNRHFGGTYTETLTGLHKNDIVVEGTFRLARIADTPVLLVFHGNAGNISAYWMGFKEYAEAVITRTGDEIDRIEAKIRELETRFDGAASDSLRRVRGGFQ